MLEEGRRDPVCGVFWSEQALLAVRGASPRPFAASGDAENAIEPVIGHIKSDGHLGRNFLLGIKGDVVNVILAAAGHNLRLLRAWVAWLLACLLSLPPPAHQVGEGS